MLTRFSRTVSQNLRFESSVVLDSSQAYQKDKLIFLEFESSVVLDSSQAKAICALS